MYNFVISRDTTEHKTQKLLEN